MREILIILLIIIFDYTTFGQNNHSPELNITIVQNILPGPDPTFTYEISKRRIRIRMTKEIFNYTIDFKRQLHSKRLKKYQLDSLCQIVKKMNIHNGKDYYSSNEFDGINWTFIIKQDSLVSSMLLNNYYLPEYGMLLDYINRQLPAKRRYISFDYFDLRKKFENK